jgi:predicted transcriptional regulator
MKNPNVISWIRKKYQTLVTDLDERGRRRWAAVEALSLGWGGVTAVSKATGISDRTIRTGIRELESKKNTEPSRQRGLGGGRKTREEKQPGLIKALGCGSSLTTII